LFFLQLQTALASGKHGHLLLCICLFTFATLPDPAFALLAPESSTSADTAITSEQDSISISSLITQSDTLVQAAISSNTNASSFRIDATLYRESLRALMISSDKASTGTAPPKEMLMELVRMSALLQSAAACKTGRYIVCPIELRQQLLAQLSRLQTLSTQTSKR